MHGNLHQNDAPCWRWPGNLPERRSPILTAALVCCSGLTSTPRPFLDRQRSVYKGVFPCGPPVHCHDVFTAAAPYRALPGAASGAERRYLLRDLLALQRCSAAMAPIGPSPGLYIGRRVPAILDQDEVKAHWFERWGAATQCDPILIRGAMMRQSTDGWCDRFQLMTMSFDA